MSVKIYSTPECQYCKQAKAFFEKNNIEYENIDVSTNDSAMEEMKKKSNGLTVPVIDIDGKILIGFDESKLKLALDIK